MGSGSARAAAWGSAPVAASGLARVAISGSARVAEWVSAQGSASVVAVAVAALRPDQVPGPTPAPAQVRDQGPALGHGPARVPARGRHRRYPAQARTLSQEPARTLGPAARDRTPAPELVRTQALTAEERARMRGPRPAHMQSPALVRTAALVPARTLGPGLARTLAVDMASERAMHTKISLHSPVLYSTHFLCDSTTGK